MFHWENEICSFLWLKAPVTNPDGLQDIGQGICRWCGIYIIYMSVYKLGENDEVSTSK